MGAWGYRSTGAGLALVAMLVAADGHAEDQPVETPPAETPASQDDKPPAEGNFVAWDKLSPAERRKRELACYPPEIREALKDIPPEVPLEGLTIELGGQKTADDPYRQQNCVVLCQGAPNPSMCIHECGKVNIIKRQNAAHRDFAIKANREKELQPDPLPAHCYGNPFAEEADESEATHAPAKPEAAPRDDLKRFPPEIRAMLADLPPGVRLDDLEIEIYVSPSKPSAYNPVPADQVVIGYRDRQLRLQNCSAFCEKRPDRLMCLKTCNRNNGETFHQFVDRKREVDRIRGRAEFPTEP